MKNLTPANIAAACGGKFHGDKSVLNTEVTAVTTDSRNITAGCLFVPIAGTRVDGHDFIPQVMEAGALVTLTERAESAAGCGSYIVVESTRDAIQKIAGFYRRQLGIPVVGITGSVGKTSTKEAIAAVLSQKYRILKTAGNFNNNLGLPLTIFRLTEEDEIAVLEMGINHFGEMTDLADTAEPDTMVITNIGTCHLEFLGDRDGVFKAKTECFDYVKLTGEVILNGDDDKLIQVKEVHGKRPIFYGMNPGFRVYGYDLRPEGIKGTTCMISLDDEDFEVHVPVPGAHMVQNALAAAAVGSLYGLTPEEIQRGIESIETIGGRLNIVEGAKCTVIDDCYNANPMSMKASLGVLANAGGRRVAVLGDMGELGKTEKELHREVGRAAGELNLDLYLLAGELSKEIEAGIRETNPDADVQWFTDADAAAAALPELIRKGDTVLVKASHFMEFTKIVEALKA